MNVIIIGCGKTGARLASQLDERGYDVAVIDEDDSKFERLSKDFSGFVVCGNAADVDVLRNAGCENADMAIVVTPNDNVNVMVAQMLQVEFELKEVYVRVLDPTREAVFRKFGLRTICPTRFETDVLFNLVTDESDDIDSVTISGSSVQFAMEKADKHEIGKKPNEILLRSGEMPFAIKKKTGQLVLCNDENMVIEDGDMIIYAIVWEDGR
ncbi:MAG: TrkA family potassium uptake protein [Ruminococcus sp.]|nr:TrkA family potassium uptake protein [Ruminococcus sp.]